MTPNRYFRLTLLLLLPLLLLGWWFEEAEILIKRGYVISCSDQVSHVQCVSYKASKYDTLNILYSPGTVRLLAAELKGGFSQPISGTGIATSRIIDGKRVQSQGTPPVKKVLTLPPPSLRQDNRGSCEIRPYVDKIKWGYSCNGRLAAAENFTFAQEAEAQKYRNAVDQIIDLKAQADTMQTRGMFVSVLAPLAVYFLLSLAFIVLMRGIRFVSGNGIRTPK